MKVEEVILARGHVQVKATHPTTLMITKDEKIGPRGDCIVAVATDKGAADLSEALKRTIKSNCVVSIMLEAGGVAETIRGIGHHDLTLTHPTDVVIRKSAFRCGRTLAINSNKAAADLPRALVKRLRNPANQVRIRIEAFE
ncbi:MAG: DUF371 domain-containing protein [Candidatus Hodarchaeaceae archaeon]|nr:DUF371 domain-containing protein [Candidatus Hodarchaeaceae archaeon]